MERIGAATTIGSEDSRAHTASPTSLGRSRIFSFLSVLQVARKLFNCSAHSWHSLTCSISGTFRDEKLSGSKIYLNICSCKNFLREVNLTGYKNVCEKLQMSLSPHPQCKSKHLGHSANSVFLCRRIENEPFAIVYSEMTEIQVQNQRLRQEEEEGPKTNVHRPCSSHFHTSKRHGKREEKQAIMLMVCFHFMLHLCFEWCRKQ